MMRLVHSILALVLACGLAFAAEPGFRTVPPILGKVSWNKTPAQVLKQPNPKEGLVWLGIVRGVSVRPGGDVVDLEIFCEYLYWVGAGPEALADHEFVAHRSTEPRFAFPLHAKAPVALGETLKRNLLSTTSYVLIGGKYAGRRQLELGKETVVVLKSEKVEMGGPLTVLVTD